MGFVACLNNDILRAKSGKPLKAGSAEFLFENASKLMKLVKYFKQKGQRGTFKCYFIMSIYPSPTPTSPLEGPEDLVPIPKDYYG